MEIKEKDFRIVMEQKQYVLYVIKSKSELKEDSADVFKVYGYYTFLGSALKAVISFRSHKKYPGKESIPQLRLELKEFNKLYEDFDIALESIYTPIINLKKIITNDN